MRGGWRRPWIKLYPVDCLDGSIRWQLESDERGVWYDILNFAAICSTPGLIADKDDRPFPHSFVANRLNIPLELFERTLKKCNEEGRTKEDGNGIRVVNWKSYQSEYQRQKPYRQGADDEKPEEDDNGELGQSMRQVWGGLGKRRDYASPNRGKESVAIKWILEQGYTPDQILGTYDKMKKDKFWSEKHLDMQSVKNQIGAILKGANDGQKTKPQRARSITTIKGNEPAGEED